MQSAGKLLIFAGLGIAALGVVLLLSGKLPFRLGRLPGDIAIERENSSFYFPITTSILLSVVLSLVLWLIGKIGRGK